MRASDRVEARRREMTGRIILQDASTSLAHVMWSRWPDSEMCPFSVDLAYVNVSKANANPVRPSMANVHRHTARASFESPLMSPSPGQSLPAAQQPQSKKFREMTHGVGVAPLGVLPQQHQNHDHYLSIQMILQLGDAIRKQFVNSLPLLTMPLKWHWHTDDPQSVVYNSEREGSEPASSGIPCVFCWYIWEITKTASGTICSLEESMKRSMMPAIVWTICVIAFKLVSYSEAQIRTCFERKLWPPNCTKLDWSSDSRILQCLLSDRKYKMQAALLSHTTQGGAKRQESLLNKDAY